MTAGHVVVSDGHGGGLVRHGEVRSPLRQVDGATKVAALVLFALAVVCVPARAWWAPPVLAVLVAVAAVAARLPVPTLLRRLVVEVPFLCFALALPLVGTGVRRDVPLLPVDVSVAGSWAAWSILSKATLCSAAAIVLAWSTPAADVVTGLQRLRVPAVVVAITASMLRYLEVVTAELSRMQVARVARCDDPRRLWQARAIAATAGTLFVRAYERGERVERAMLARGFTGRYPDLGPAPTRRGRSLVAAWVLAAWVVAAVAALAPAVGTTP